MNYEFYADIFFLSNFYMDFLAIYAVNGILEGKRRIKRFLLGCGIGSLLGLLLFIFVKNYTVYILLVHFLLNPAMVIFCFSPAAKEVLLKAWLLMYFILLLLGGSVEWLYQTLMGGRYYEMCLLLSAVPIMCLLYILRRKRKNVQLFYDVEIVNKGKKVSLRAYFDTGNRLMDPYVGLPVQIVGEETAASIFEEGAYFPRLIPYTSVGNPGGMIKAVTVEEIRVTESGNRIQIAPAILAMADDDVFCGKNYKMILNFALEEKLYATKVVEKNNWNGEKKCT